MVGNRYNFIKRAIDVLVSSTCIVLLSPVLCIVMFTIWVEDGRPVLFRQTRVGINGSYFSLLKFRSMYVNTIPVEEMGQVSGHNPLVTKVGRVIRRLKIDELPQLFNVLLGDMSLVGPRPTVPEQVEKYSDFEMKRLSVKPGMTGWAQVNGNINLTWEDRILLDRWYIDNWSLWLDIKILARTVAVILFGERVNQYVIEEAAACEDSDSRSRI